MLSTGGRSVNRLDCAFPAPDDAPPVPLARAYVRKCAMRLLKGMWPRRRGGWRGVGAGGDVAPQRPIREEDLMAQKTYWENGREKIGTMMSREFCSTGISLRKVRPGRALANWRARVAHSASEARY